MKSVSLASSQHLAAAKRPGWLEGLARNGLMRQLQSLETGRVSLTYQGHEQVFGEISANRSENIEAGIAVHDGKFFSDIAFGGEIGAGESYMLGHWDCDDLVSLVRLLLRNRQVIEGMDGGAARLMAPLQKLYHWVNRNSREGARRNIAAHYDLGNDFFALWLDATMMYSSAIFTNPEMSLHQAQLARLDHICEKLQLNENDHLVEIGTGWGGLAIHAVQKTGCRVTTTTISRAQFELARERVQAAGLESRITVLMQDFRDLQGEFDKLVSIEMIEAIDRKLYRPYFKKCSELLKPDGLALVQAITMSDQRYAVYRKSIDFIQRYIFPGSGLPSAAVMTDIVARETDMRLLNLEDIGLHYATTLNCWRQNFFANIGSVRAQGYPEAFIRMWDYYLCYCEAAFLERAISDIQVVFAKPGNRVRLI